MAVFAAVLAVTVTHLGSGGAGSCAIERPAPSLSSRLRSLGGFDQPQDPSDTAGLQAFAAQAGSAVAAGLIGTVPQAPVRVSSLRSNQPDAIVIPLLSTGQPGQRRVVAGLVALVLDCAGRAYYSAVDDLTLRTASAPPAFPALTKAGASAALGTADPQLVYEQSPFAVLWRNRDTGATVVAFAA